MLYCESISVCDHSSDFFLSSLSSCPSSSSALPSSSCALSAAGVNAFGSRSASDDSFTLLFFEDPIITWNMGSCRNHSDECQWRAELTLQSPNSIRNCLHIPHGLPGSSSSVTGNGHIRVLSYLSGSTGLRYQFFRSGEIDTVSRKAAVL